MKETKAIAFLEALLGWEDVGEEHSRPKSPHARTHLEAVLGSGSLNIQTYGTKFQKRDKDKLFQLSQFLQDVGGTIEANVHLMEE